MCTNLVQIRFTRKFATWHSTTPHHTAPHRTAAHRIAQLQVAIHDSTKSQTYNYNLQVMTRCMRQVTNFSLTCCVLFLKILRSLKNFREIPEHKINAQLQFAVHDCMHMGIYKFLAQPLRVFLCEDFDQYSVSEKFQNVQTTCSSVHDLTHAGSCEFLAHLLHFLS